MTVKDNLRYTKDHEWLQILDNNEALVGVTDFAQGELGDIVFIEVETVGETLNKEEVFGTIEAVKTVSDMFMPVSGKVIAFNEALTASPDLVNKDPYEAGWIIKIKLSNPAEIEELFTAEAYKGLIS